MENKRTEKIKVWGRKEENTRGAPRTQKKTLKSRFSPIVSAAGTTRLR
jgi:hypothetical protein